MYESKAYKIVKDQIDSYFKQAGTDGIGSLNPFSKSTNDKN